jgi:hypothetical protein
VQYPGSFSIVDFVPGLTRPLPQYPGDLILCNTRAATISGQLDSVQYPGSFSIVDFVPGLTRPLPQYPGDLILCNTRQLFGCGFHIGFKRDLLGRGGVMGSGHNNGPFL